jgi:hypothetical protein
MTKTNNLVFVFLFVLYLTQVVLIFVVFVYWLLRIKMLITVLTKEGKSYQLLF